MLMDKRNLLYFDTDEGAGGATDGASEGEQGSTVPQIDWSKIDPSTIPVDVIKQNPEYKQVLDESIKRRQKIAKLTETLDDKPQGDTQEKPKTPTDVPDWAKPLIEAVSQIQEATKQKSLTELRVALAGQAGWTPEQASHLTATDEAGIKAQIAEFEKTFDLKGKRFGGMNANGDSDTDKEAVRSRLLEKLGGKGSQIKKSVFDKDFQDF